VDQLAKHQSGMKDSDKINIDTPAKDEKFSFAGAKKWKDGMKEKFKNIGQKKEQPQIYNEYI
jgi:hypothetical protein